MAEKKKKAKKKSKNIKIELTRASLFLWILFFIFLLIWVFILGIFAGRGMIPEAITELTEPLQNVQQMIEENDKKETPKTKKEPELDFYKKLASKKDEVKRNGNTEKKKTTPREISLKPEPEKQKAESAPQGMYSIQVASISHEIMAEKLARELVDKGYDAYYYTAAVRGKTTYRVMCGRFEGFTAASELLTKLKKETGHKGFITRIDN